LSADLAAARAWIEAKGRVHAQAEEALWAD